ncbi:MAG: hypothetical protein K2W96_16835 [Gemmataceae bacterium]|nr:hypothetical protein [Gemmataceae bacterium]
MSATKRKRMEPEASEQARRLAVLVLEVLAGSRGPAEAAEAAGMSLPRYYAAEKRAMRGLLAGCEPVKRGRKASGEGAPGGLREEVERLRQQCARQQALLRLQQRSLGLDAPQPTAKGGKKRRKPRRRMLKLMEDKPQSLQGEPPLAG